MSNIEKNNIAEMVEYYLNNFNITHIFFILDIRHLPTNDDRQMYEYLLEQNIPFTIVANKCDKLNISKIDKNIADIRKFLFAKEDIIHFSGYTKKNVELIQNLIEDIINN